jgi:hypothetical protein
MRTIKTYRKVGAFYIAWEVDFIRSLAQARYTAACKILVDATKISAELNNL